MLRRRSSSKKCFLQRKISTICPGGAGVGGRFLVSNIIKRSSDTSHQRHSSFSSRCNFTTDFFLRDLFEGRQCSATFLGSDVCRDTEPTCSRDLHTYLPNRGDLESPRTFRISSAFFPYRHRTSLFPAFKTWGGGTMNENVNSELIQALKQIDQTNALTLTVVAYLCQVLHDTKVQPLDRTLSNLQTLLSEMPPPFDAGVAKNFLSNLQSCLRPELKPNNQQSTNVH